MNDKAPSELTVRMNHVFIDFENVHQVDLATLGEKPATFYFLVGPKQSRIDISLVEQLFTRRLKVHFIRLTASGRNALDFALVYYLGQTVVADPAGYFHLVSRDTGYDPLIDHLQSEHVKIRRHIDASALTFSMLPRVPPLPCGDQISRVLEHLRKNTTNRPKREKTLQRHLLAFVGKTATEKIVSSLIEQLKKQGQLTIDDRGALTYRL